MGYFKEKEKLMPEYYICKILKFPEMTNQGLTRNLLLEFVDCKAPTLNPNIFNSGFAKRELAEEYIRNLGSEAEIHVVVYQPFVK